MTRTELRSMFEASIDMEAGDPNAPTEDEINRSQARMEHAFGVGFADESEAFNRKYNPHLFEKPRHEARELIDRKPVPQRVRSMRGSFPWTVDFINHDGEKRTMAFETKGDANDFIREWRAAR